MTETDFDHYPLHDAVIVCGDVSWAERELVLRLYVFYEATDEALPATLTFTGLGSMSTSMQRPWGDAAEVTILDQRHEPGGKYVLQLNTGDEVRVTADAAVLERI
jgi:hypothetical protein